MMTPPTTSATSTASTGPSTARIVCRPMLLMRRPSSHQQPQFGPADLAAPELADDAALVEHDQPVAEIEHLVEIERQHQYRLVVVARVDDLAVHELDCAD